MEENPNAGKSKTSIIKKNCFCKYKRVIYFIFSLDPDEDDVDVEYDADGNPIVPVK